MAEHPFKSRLGRIPSPPDERDYTLENFVKLGVDTDEAVDANTVYSELQLTTVTYRVWAAKKYDNVEDTHWWKALNALGVINPSPNPGPNPNPPGNGNVWADAEAVLDQGDFGTCVGNGYGQWGNTLPVDDKYTEGIGESATTGGPYARAIYYEATVLDGSPDDPDAKDGGQQGATVRSGAKVMVNRKRASAYAFTTSIDTVKTYLQTKGPIVIGSNWFYDMFEPDASGYVTPTGAYQGGHCYVLVGYDDTEGCFIFLNSWGDQWGVKGYFKMKYEDFQTLISDNGEMCAIFELLLAA